MCWRKSPSSRTAPLPVAFIARDATTAKITAHKNSIKEAGMFMKQTQQIQVMDQTKQRRISQEHKQPPTPTETQLPSPPPIRKSSWKFSQRSMLSLSMSGSHFSIREPTDSQSEKEMKQRRVSRDQVLRKLSHPLQTAPQTVPQSDLSTHTPTHSFRQRMATAFSSSPFLRRLTQDTSSHNFEAPSYRERQELATLSSVNRSTKERRNSVLLRFKRRQSTGTDSLLQFQVVDGTQASVYEVKLTEIQLVKRLAFGPLSEVYAAIWRETKVGVKLLMPREGVVDRLEDAVQNFRREIWVMSSLKHPNIVTLIGASLTPTCYVLVMEYMSNGSLYEYLRDEDNIFPHSMILTSAWDIASGMNHLVQRQVLQRDLKSKNCLLSDNLVVKVADFGLARFKSTDNNYTFVGTPFWAAPEVIRHEPYDEKADVYSFAIVLWELVERKDPYDGLNPFQVPLLVAQDGLRPHDYTRSAPLGLDHLMKQCWDSNPDQRPTFEEIEQTLDRWLKAAEDRIELHENSIGEEGDQEGDLSKHIQRKCTVANEQEVNRFAMSHSASSKVIPILLARGTTERKLYHQLPNDTEVQSIPSLKSKV